MIARLADAAVTVAWIGGLVAAASAFHRDLDDGVLRETFGAAWWPRSLLVMAAVALVAATVDRRGAGPSDAAVARRVFIALVAAATLKVAFLQPFDMTRLLTVFAWVLGLLAALRVGSRRVGRPARAPRWLRTVEVVAFNLCLLAVLGELGLRGLAKLHVTPLLARSSGAPAEILAHFRCTPGELRYGFPCDERGYYDVAPDAERSKPLVCVIGDSFSTGVVPHSFHYTTVAERLTGADIYNMGAASLAPPEYLHLLHTEALPLSPDAVVIALFVGNDLHFPRRRLYSWFSRDQVLVVQVPRRLLRIRQEEERTGRQAGVAPGAGDEQHRISDPRALRDAYPWLEDPTLEIPAWSETAYLELEIERAVTACAADDAIYRRLFGVLDQMIDACGDIPLVFLVIPDEFQVEDDLWSRITDAVGRRLDRDRPQRKICGWLRERGIPWCDLLPSLRAVAPGVDGRRRVFHLRDTHLNARGNQIAGERLAATLADVLGR